MRTAALATCLKLCVALCLTMASCAPEPTLAAGSPRSSAVVSQQVVGDWNDVDVACGQGGAEARVASLGSTDSTLADGRKVTVWRFLASDDRQFELTATQASVGAGEAASGPIILTAKGEPYRDVERERALVRGASKRLRQLAGREWAPID
jgi:hypothetical protein